MYIVTAEKSQTASCFLKHAYNKVLKIKKRNNNFFKVTRFTKYTVFNGIYIYIRCIILPKGSVYNVNTIGPSSEPLCFAVAELAGSNQTEL